MTYMLDLQCCVVTGVEQSDSNIHICSFFPFFSILHYCKIMNVVPCAVQQILFWGHLLCGMWDLSSQIRDQTHVACIRSSES